MMRNQLKSCVKNILGRVNSQVKKLWFRNKLTENKFLKQKTSKLEHNEKVGE